MRILVAFTLISTVATLVCYQSTQKPKNPTDCPANATQCYKLGIYDNQNARHYYYGCDIPAARDTAPHCVGISNGLCSKRDDATICCCGTDGCNSSGFYQPLIAVIVIFIGIFIS